MADETKKPSETKSQTRLGSVEAEPKETASAAIRAIQEIREWYRSTPFSGAGHIAEGEREAREWRERERLIGTIEQSERSSEKATVPEKPAKPDFWTLADKAMLGLCEVLALLFGLPFGEDLYSEKPVTGWHLFYLAIGLLFAVTGPMWPWIRTRTWLPASIAASLSKAPLDARLWIAALLLLFLYGTAPEIYRRATAPMDAAKTSPGATVKSTTRQSEKSIDVAKSPTTLRLLFKAGEIEEIEAKNVIWTKLLSKEYLKNPHYIAPLPPPPPAPGSFNFPSPSGSFNSLNPEYIWADVWTIVLVFKQPVLFKQIHIDDHGAGLVPPSITSNDYYAIIQFHSNIQNALIDVSAVNEADK